MWLPSPKAAGWCCGANDREGPQKYGIMASGSTCRATCLGGERSHHRGGGFGKHQRIHRRAPFNGNALLLYMWGRNYLYHDSVFALAIANDGDAAWAAPTRFRTSACSDRECLLPDRPQLLPLADGPYMGWSFNSVCPRCAHRQRWQLLDPCTGTSLPGTNTAFLTMHSDLAVGSSSRKGGHDNSPLQPSADTPEGASLWNPPLV